MLKWLRNLIRGWIFYESDAPPNTLDVRINGVPRQANITGRRGLMLICNITDEYGGRIIGENHANNKKHYWRIWKQYGGPAKWEDGTPFIPI